jgi:peptidoglycan/xylan/chitin deacetylase (PgdA/CDA1 family)
MAIHGPPLILAYHGIADIPSRRDPARLFVSPKHFRAQVRSLSRRQYQFLRISEFAQLLHAETLPKGICALTFDDGSEDNGTVLAPMLRELGIPATLYVCPGLLGRPYPWTEPEAGIRFMDRTMLVELAGDPLIEIGSHTREHDILVNANAEDAYREMAASKGDLEELLDLEVSSFAYPRCKYSPACPPAAQRAGYTSAVTCGRRGGWEPFALRRDAIRRDDGAVTFALKCRGLYRWARDLQAVDLAAHGSRRYRHRDRA